MKRLFSSFILSSLEDEMRAFRRIIDVTKQLTWPGFILSLLAITGCAVLLSQTVLAEETYKGEGAEAETVPVTLDKAIRETLEVDPKLRAALQSVDQARADLWTSGILPNPTLTVQGVYLPFREFTPEKPGGPPELDVIVGFPIDWFLFGKRAAAMSNARCSVDVARADYGDQVRQRVAGTVAAFYDVLAAGEMLALARQDLENLQRVETMTRDRFKAGGGAAIEQERIRLSVIDAEREVRDRRAVLITAGRACERRWAAALP